MGQLAIPIQQQIDDLTAKTALADYVGAELHLYSNDMTPDENSVLADFTECAYTGYAAEAITWSVPFIDENNVVTSSGGEKIFDQTGSAATDQCFGGFLTDTAGTTLLGAFRLDDPPFNFSGTGVALTVTIKLTMGGGIGGETPIP